MTAINLIMDTDTDDEDNDDDDCDEGGGDDVCFADGSGVQLITASMIMTAGTDETTGRMYLIVATSASSRPPSFAISPLMMR